MRNILIFIYYYIDEIEQFAVKSLFQFCYIMVCMLVNIAVFIIVNYLQNECIYRHSQFYEKKWTLVLEFPKFTLSVNHCFLKS